MQQHDLDTALPPRVREVAAAVSNAGRWGSDDERGTLNFVTPEKTIEAASLVRSGRVISASHDFNMEPTPHKPRAGYHRMLWRETGTTATDAFMVESHGFEVTHVDALAHVSLGGQTYNGRAFDEVLTRDGLTFGSVLPLAAGIATRGVLLDLPASQNRDWLDRGEEVTVDDLERAEAWAGITATSGDALVVRVGLQTREQATGMQPPDVRTGLGWDCIEWLHDREIAVFGGDCFERLPSTAPGLASPLHEVGLARMGLVLIDHIAVEELAVVCAEEARWEFFFNAAPLRIPRATGSPVNPLCIF